MVENLVGGTAAGAGTGAVAGGPIGAVIGGAVGLGSSLIGGLFGSYNTNKANRHSLENAKIMAELNDKYQRDLIRDSPMLQKQGLINAGLSPAFSDGYAAVTSSDASQQAPTAKAAPIPQLFGASDFANLVNADSQRIVAEAQARNLDEDTKTKSIRNLSEEDLREAELNSKLLENEASYIDWYIAHQTQDVQISKILTEKSILDNKKDMQDLDLALRTIDTQYYNAEKSIALQIQLSTFANLQKDLDIKDKTMSVLVSQAFLNYAKGHEAIASAEQIRKLTPVLTALYGTDVAQNVVDTVSTLLDLPEKQWNNKVLNNLDPETEAVYRRVSQVIHGGSEVAQTAVNLKRARGSSRPRAAARRSR